MNIGAHEYKREKCPFLKGTYVFSCGRDDDVYVPSNFELEEYCTKMRYRICPFYCKGKPRHSIVLSVR